jgi:ABC-type proline/glycine betaine transport system permease subunit
MSDTDIKTALDIFIENSLKKCLKSEYISDANIDKFKLNTDKLTNFSSIILTNKYINTEYGKPYLKNRDNEDNDFDSRETVIKSLNPTPPTLQNIIEKLNEIFKDSTIYNKTLNKYQLINFYLIFFELNKLRRTDDLTTLKNTLDSSDIFNLTEAKITKKSNLNITDLLKTDYEKVFVDILYFYFYFHILFIYVNLLPSESGSESNKIDKDSYNNHISQFTTDYNNRSYYEKSIIYDDHIRELKNHNTNFLEEKDKNIKNKIRVDKLKKNIDNYYKLLYFIIVILIICMFLLVIVQKNKNKFLYTYMILAFLIILNIYYSTNLNIVIVEEFISENNEKEELLELIKGLKLTNVNNTLIEKTNNKLVKEKKLYKDLNKNLKAGNIRYLEKINDYNVDYNVTKELISMIMRIIIVFLILFIIYISREELPLIIKITGGLFLLFFVGLYLYSLKVISRTDYTKRFWNHKFKFNNNNIHGYIL